MNYVAHQVLSFGQQEIQLGNLMGEVIKGKDFEVYKPEIQKGILLHRFIDTFTDSHPIVHQCTKLLHTEQGKYSPIIIDVIFDYLLIKNWSKFVDQDFETFKINCYQIFKSSEEIFPPRLTEILYYMLKYDWFANYSTLEGVSKTLENIGKRTPYENNLHNTHPVLLQNIEALEQNFLEFYPILEKNCHDFLFG